MSHGYDQDYQEWMDEKYDMEHWRWCDELSVVEAAMLVVGLNPSLLETVHILDGAFHKIGTSNHISNSSHFPNFVPVFHAISRAVESGQLACRVVHHWVDEDDEFEHCTLAQKASTGLQTDWRRSLVSIQDFRSWMTERKVKPAFFFPDTPLINIYFLIPPMTIFLQSLIWR